MKCANCGKEIQTGDTFCPHCGERLTGFSIQEQPAGSVRMDEEDLTYIGHYDQPEGEEATYGRTFIDSSGNRYQSSVTEDHTYLDTSGAGDNPWNPSGTDTIRADDSPSPVYGTITEDRAFPGTDYGNPSRRKDDFQTPNHRYTAPPYTHPAQDFAGVPAKNNIPKTVLIAAIALVLLVVAGTVLFFSRNITPKLDDLTYDELVAEYELSGDDSDKVKSAYYENVRFEFDEVTKSNGGYKASAMIYTPDMEEIYQQTTDPEEVIKKLNRLSEDNLDYQKKTVMLKKTSDVLSDSSAKSLQTAVNNRYLAPEEYEGKSSGSDAAVQTPSSTPDISQNAPAASQNTDSGTVQQQETPASSSTSGAAVITGASATSTLYEKGYDHSPSNVLDGRLSTAWVEGASGQGTGERLTLTFDGAYTISSMTIHAGYQKSARLYSRNSRPKTMTLFFSDGSNESVALSDTNAAQTLYLVNPVTTSSVVIQIDSVYAGSVYQDTCISEVRFQ